MTTTVTPWVFHDGGRATAGFKGSAPGDCVVRAAAIVTGRPYKEVYNLVNTLARKPVARTGVPKPLTRRLMAHLGLEWVPTMGIGTGTRVHLRADELPGGSLVVQVTKHVVAVIDGIVYDTHDPSRDGTRCVYGYWRHPAGGAR